MKKHHWALSILHVVGWTLLAIVLLALGILFTLYSPWGQNKLKDTLVGWLNSRPGVEAQMDTLRLKFPLDLELKGVRLVQNGDTVIAARRLEANVALMPLLKGSVDAKRVFLDQGRFQLGNADSLTMMVITADTLEISPAVISLSSIDIDLQKGYISGALVSLISKPDTAATSTPPDTTTTMKIKVGDIDLRDFTYQMQLVPTIDSLGTTVGYGRLHKGLIDLREQTVTIESFTGTKLNAAYVACDSAQIAANPVPVDTDTAYVKPWTVQIDSIHFSDSQGLYTTKGWEPQPGLDFSYIQADEMDLTVTNFYNQATTLRLPIEMSGRERCGVFLNARGTFSMDSLSMYFQDFDVSTSNTLLHASGELGVGDMLTDPDLPLQLSAEGELGFPDLKLMFPFAEPYLAGMPADDAVDLAIDLDGRTGCFDVSRLNLGINKIVKIKGSGHIDNAFSPEGPDGTVKLWGDIIDPKSLMKSLVAGDELTIPPMTLDGQVAMNHGNIQGSLQANTALGGNLALDAKYLATAEGYDIDLRCVEFPVNAFMPTLGIGRVTATVKAHGNGFDPFAATTNMDVYAQVHNLNYQGEHIQDVTAAINLHDGEGKINAHSDNKALDLTLTAQGNLTGDSYDWTFGLDGRNIDLYALKFSPDEGDVMLNLNGNASYAQATRHIAANVSLRTLDYIRPVGDINISDVRLTFDATDSIVDVGLTNRDLNARAQAKCGLDSLVARFADVAVMLDEQLAKYTLMPDTLQTAMPKFDIYLSAGRDNLINDILAPSKTQIQSMRLRAENDTAISLKAQVLGIGMPTMNIDTVGVLIKQRGNKMQMIAKVDNRPGTLDQFAHIRLDGMLNTNQVAIRGRQQNIQGETGFDIGALLNATADSVINMRLFPLNPVIGYKDWTVNLDNYISYNVPHHHIDANLKMQGAGSSLQIYTEQAEHAMETDNQELFIKIKDIQLADWIVINPFAPAIKGSLSTDLRVLWDGGKNINGDGTVALADFTYGGQPVGTFESSLDVSTNTDGMIRAKADLLVDGVKTMTVAGVLNDSTSVSPFDLDLDMIQFPLRVANPFLPADVATLTGTLNGNMCISGDMENPLLNGKINFEDAAVRLIMTNTSYRFSDVEIPVVDSNISFNDFGIYGANDNPLTINGNVDIHSLISPKINLDLKAQNMMLVNTNKAAKSAEIFGKAYIDLGATVKGNMEFMSVKANLTVLNGTNVTYVMSDAAATLQQQQQSDMVKWVNFSDSTAVEVADSIRNSAMMLLLDANLNIQNGTTINVNLSTTARDKIMLQPEGSLTFSMSPLSDPRLTGRIVLNDGMARYTIPVIGQEKTFTFDQGSYIAFNGDMFNPTLNVHATDVVKTNVTQTGQNSRLVNFNILLGITGTLANMNVAFNLSTNDDMTIANELESMSAEQRANQAMNLLLYNVYTGPGVKASGNLSANPLFSFLESQVNNWAAQNIKGVDLTFGIDQYNQTTNGSTSTAMSYSYQVSKSLFNDRFKIVVGGNYTTDDNPDENLSENLISDISFEYFLNKQRTMLVKLFRHTGYESILEGEITKTGVGFVYRRKLNNLVQILPRILRPEKYKKIR